VVALVNPERLADPWIRWLESAVDYADDVADGLIHPKDVPARPKAGPHAPPRPCHDAMSDATYRVLRREYEEAVERVATHDGLSTPEQLAARKRARDRAARGYHI
jgi:hypothetical protein